MNKERIKKDMKRELGMHISIMRKLLQENKRDAAHLSMYHARELADMMFRYDFITDHQAGVIDDVLSLEFFGI